MLVLQIQNGYLQKRKKKIKRKIKLVACGFQQVPGEDFIENYSPTIQAERVYDLL